MVIKVKVLIFSRDKDLWIYTNKLPYENQRILDISKKVHYLKKQIFPGARLSDSVNRLLLGSAVLNYLFPILNTILSHVFVFDNK